MNTNPNVVEMPPEDYAEQLRALGVSEHTIKAVLARQAALPAKAGQ